MLVLFMVAMATVTTQAQTRDSVAFQPHWFVQPQVGVGYHVGAWAVSSRRSSDYASVRRAGRLATGRHTPWQSINGTTCRQTLTLR